MHYILSQRSKVLFLIYSVILIMFKPITAEAQLVKDVTIDTLADGYEITIHFEFLIRYQSHTPLKASDYLWIEIRPVDFNRLDEQDVESLRERLMLGWDRETSIPLKEITYEGGDPKHPQITFVFTKKVEYEVRSSVDLRSLIVTVKTKVSHLPEEVKEDIPEEIKEEVVEEIAEELPEEKENLEDKVEGVPSEELVTIQADNLDKLMAEAKTAMTEDNYSRAVQIYTKILGMAEGDMKKQAQEYLGLARERNGQSAHGKAEYEKYLKEYPEGPDAERVRQRLAGLVTAAKKPKEQIEEVKRPMKIVEKPKWQMRYYGNVSQFFSRNQTFLEDGETQVNRNDLDTNLDLNSISASEDYDIRTKYTGSYQTSFMPNEATLGSLSALSLEVRHKKSDLYGKIGRQSSTSGGVLGRFDGAHISYDITP
jgi:tetratricopeptide (TPR) repeat protein